MMILFLFSATLAGILALVASFGELIGPGKWMVHNVDDLPDSEQYSFRPKCRRNKLNRTHDCFRCELDLEFEIDNTYGLYIDVLKKVDGGYKPYMKMEYECLCCILKEKTRDNFEKALRLANVDPTDCPVPKGHHNISNYVFDYSELEKSGVYGSFLAYTYVTRGTKDKIIGGVTLNLEFDKEGTDDDD